MQTTKQALTRKYEGKAKQQTSDGKRGRRLKNQHQKQDLQHRQNPSLTRAIVFCSSIFALDKAKQRDIEFWIRSSDLSLNLTHSKNLL